VPLDVTPDPDLVVSVQDVVKRIPGLTYDNLTQDQYDVIEAAILDAQADVEAYLGRPIMPVERVETGRWPYADGWDLDPGDEPRTSITVLSSAAETDENGSATGYFTVTYRVGLNAKTDRDLRPVLRFIAYAAMNTDAVVQTWAKATKAKGPVKSMGAEGQSVTFDRPNLGVTGTKPGDLAPGSAPTLRSLDRWRLAGRRVYQGRTRTTDWPFTGAPW
jgi:hypothetical protein